MYLTRAACVLGEPTSQSIVTHAGRIVCYCRSAALLKQAMHNLKQYFEKRKEKKVYVKYYPNLQDELSWSAVYFFVKWLIW